MLFRKLLTVIAAVMLILTAGFTAVATLPESTSFFAAYAESVTTVKITGTVLNVRSGAGTSYAKVTTVRKGESYTSLGSAKDSSGKVWYKISVGGKTGYVISSYVSVTSVETQTLTVTGTNVNVRSGAGTGNSKVASVNKGAKFTVEGSAKDSSGKVWYKITVNGKVGYIISSYVTVSGTSTTTTTTTKNTTATTKATSAASTQTLTVTGTNVNVRKGAGTNNAKLTVVKKGAVFSVLGSAKDSAGKVWYKISVNGATGYIISTYVKVTTVTTTTTTAKSTTTTASGTSSSTTAAPTTTTTTTEAPLPSVITVTASSANIYSGAGTSYSVRATAAYGSVYSVMSKITDSSGISWYRIIINEKAGYIKVNECASGAITTTTSASTGTTTTTTTAGGGSSSGITINSSYTTGIVNVGSGTLTVRNGAGAGYASIGTIDNGKKVFIVETQNEWYRILFAGGYGWVSSTYVTGTKTESVSAALSYAQSYYYVNVGGSFDATKGLAGLPVTYTSGDPVKAPVSTSGIVMCDNPGVYDIKISCGSYSSSTVLVVLKAPNSGIEPLIISDAGIAFIATWEGGATVVGEENRYYPYQDVSGFWTVGHGFAIVDAGSTSWSKEKAVERFNNDITALLGEIYVPMDATKDYLTQYETEMLLKIDLLEAGYNTCVSDWSVRNGVILTQNQHDALVSFAYNLGQSYFANDNVKFYLKSAIISMRSGADADRAQIFDGFTRYIKSKGINYKGLYYRRINEAEMFVDGDYTISRDYVLPNLIWG